MNEITLDDITQSQYDEASRVLIDMMRTKYPKLDLRNGTALRDLLINPDATISAWFTQQLVEQRDCSSLKLLQQRVANGEEIDVEDVEAILSNFGMQASNGAKAQGKIRVNVSDSRTYVMAEGMIFSTVDSRQFVTTAEYTIKETPGAGELKLYAGTAGYYFILPVIASETGAAYNLKKGDAVSPDSSFYGFVSAVAYADFAGGSDVEDISSIIARIPSALSQRGLLTNYAVEGQLRQKFDDGDHPLVAVSACGYGNPAQLRDRHNDLKIGVGGRVDVYVRNFTEAPIASYQVEFTKDTDTGYYVATLPQTQTVGTKTTVIPAAGVQAVLAVSSPYSGSIGSYGFYVTYGATGLDTTWHDIYSDTETDPDRVAVEAANTIWREVTITVTEHDLSDDSETLQVTMITLPEAEDLQEYVDAESVRNIGSDYVVRCPLVCQVHVTATVRCPRGVNFDVETAKQAVCQYINSTGFIKKLSRSEIACILQAQGAISVPLGTSDMLYGEIYDSLGDKHILTGDSLDISAVANPSRLLTPDTCVFTCSPEDVEIFPVYE